MASLEALAKSYKAKKAEVSKLRKKSENSLRETLSLKRRSASGLNSLERKKDALARRISSVIQLLNQYRSQKESISRLKVESDERLKRELDEQDSVKQQIDYGSPEEKASMQERLRFVDERISELRAGLREREAAEVRLERQISDLEKEKARLDSQVKKQVHIKPGLMEQLRSSQKAESMLRPKVTSLIKREEHAARALQSVAKKLAESLVQRRKAGHKARGAKRRNATKKAKRKTVKRETVRRSKTKRPVRRSKTRAMKRTGKTSRAARKSAGKKIAKRRGATRTQKRNRGALRPRNK